MTEHRDRLTASSIITDVLIEASKRTQAWR
jgi:hypothetical protein